MNDNVPIQNMLGDLHSRYSKLLSDLERLKGFQQKIELLKEQARNDNKAREMLTRLDEAFPNGLHQDKTQIITCISKMKIQFKQLETQLKNISSGGQCS
ncbi:chromosome partitioning protein ParA [Yersinia pekkanenii]|uniref:Chromosome segregation ATPase n=1 Tax=Yersinia pekkanenii TaxID=1288385 RepID=A0A0T9QRB6_9GAMM|nr:chromosome partitioning protein ParA [Yersinia pekkanenii]CNI24683.1 Chromosome segregation ATPase [Yersinia pekkanenii]CRY68895.1 Chromosome segregation ATPase [Yersinia pekkanenii]